MELLQAIGFSAPAGLNAYLTLLLVGLAARFDWIQLEGGWADRLTNPYVLGGLAVLTVWEVVVDKVPGADHVNDVIGTVVRPASGALLMLATPNPLTEDSPALAIGVGAGLAGALHLVKALLRPLVTVSTAGVGNPVVSTLEDGAAAGTVFVAMIAPVLIVFLLLAIAGVFWWALGKWRRRRKIEGVKV